MPAARTAKRPRTEPKTPVSESDRQRERINDMLTELEDLPPFRVRETATNMFVPTPPALASKLSRTVVLFFDYQNPYLIRYPVFFSLEDATSLTDDQLCELLHNAALASRALGLVSSIFDSAGVIAKLGETARADITFLHTPRPDEVILHIAPDGLHVGYSAAPQLRVLIDMKSLDDAEALATLIIQATPAAARTPLAPH